MYFTSTTSTTSLTHWGSGWHEDEQAQEIQLLNNRIDELEKELLKYVEHDTMMTEDGNSAYTETISDFRFTTVSLETDPELCAKIQKPITGRPRTKEEWNKIMKGVKHG